MAPSQTDAGRDTGLKAAVARCNKETIEDAMQSISNLSNGMETLEHQDPDIQATVTDFLDFTDYLCADIRRSLTLIGKLDQTYVDTSGDLHELLTRYGSLSEAPIAEKEDPVELRANIMKTVRRSVSSRTLSEAEAIRMSDNVTRHYNRIKNIVAKLEAIDANWPTSPEGKPVAAKPKSPLASRGPKLTLRLDGIHAGGVRLRRNRAPRITVPGEVLAPYEIDYLSCGEDSDNDGWDELTSRLTPGPLSAPGQNAPKIKIKFTTNGSAIKEKKEKRKGKTLRQPRPLGATGTNVHSLVAGISTTNALAQLEPPPPDAVNGDEHLPWLQLNAYELAKLRKRMKKNAIWVPSDTMIARELKDVGRGIEAYRAAKQKAEAAGETLDTIEPPQLRGETVHTEGAISVEALRTNDNYYVNRGMKLNEAKKQKREKELARAAEEAEEAARHVAKSAEAMKGLFNNKTQEKKLLMRNSAKPLSRKRKRESPVDPAPMAEYNVESDAVKTHNSPVKRSKTETPVPAPLSLASKQASVVMAASTQSATSEAMPITTTLEAPAEGIAVPAPINSPKKSSTPILPPVRETKKPIKKEMKAVETAANSRPRRSSGAPTPTTPFPPVSDPLPVKRPSSSRSMKASLDGAVQATTASTERSRRASTARNTPAPESRAQGKRTKRPAPGVATSSSEGSATVRVGKRSAATRKKAGPKKEKKDGREGSVAQEIYDEIDDEGNIIDPDEPRYCSCNRVSFGTMISCDNEDDCEKEWFHLECVDLLEIPPRTTKWYCPQCRIKLGIGQKGEVDARGKKK